jgi:hypothetical protein
MAQEIDQDIEALEQILLSKSFKPEEVANDIDTEIESLELMLAQKQEPGLMENIGSGVLNAAVKTGEVIDSYTGAPTRAALGEMVQGNYGNMLNAYGKQFGEDPSLAPTGKEISQVAGLSAESLGYVPGSVQISDEQRARQGKYNPNYGQESKGFDAPSPAGITGLGIDVLADPTNLIPFVPASKILTKTGQGLNKFVRGGAKAVDAATGLPIVKTGEFVADTSKAAFTATKNAKERLTKLFKPDIAPDFEHQKSVLEANGVSTDWVPESLEYGERSMPSRMARNKAEGPLGADDLEKHHKFIQDVSGATEKKIAKIGNGSIPDAKEAGQIVRDGWDEGTEKFFSQMDATYNNATMLAPDMRLTKEASGKLNKTLDKMEGFAKGRLQDTGGLEKIIDSANATKKQKTKASAEYLEALSSTNVAITKAEKSQAKEILNAVRIAKKAQMNTASDMSQTINAMRDIGKIAFKSKNSLAEIPSDVKAFREMYFALQESVTDSIRKNLGDEFADGLKANNKQMSDFFQKQSRLSEVIGSKNVANEDVFQRLIVNGDSDQIANLKYIIPEESFNKLRSAYLNKMVNRNADNVINFNSTRKKLNGQRDHLKNLFSDEELLDLDDILNAGDKAGQATLSSSGTGASNMFSDLKGTVQNAIGGDILLDNLKKGARKRAEIKKNISGGKFIRKGAVPVAKFRDISQGKSVVASDAVRSAAIDKTDKDLESKRMMAGKKDNKFKRK